MDRKDGDWRPFSSSLDHAATGCVKMVKVTFSLTVCLREIKVALDFFKQPIFLLLFYGKVHWDGLPEKRTVGLLGT